MDFGSSSRFPLQNHHHHHHHQYSFQSSSSNNNNNADSRNDFEQPQQQEMESSSVFVEKEHMFDKVVTPSDVGKLNRLVIPKQHAEKYFPLDSSSNEKGLLLNFEDRCGKSWRFRYSYWTSSQSYVMTKGWSRFVKEKRLDAGDIVSFQRGLGDLAKDRFFIDWRRRPPTATLETAIGFHPHHHGVGGGQFPHHFQLHQWSPPVATPLSLHRDHVLHLPQNNSNHHNNVSLFHNRNNPYNRPHHYHHHHNCPPLIATGGDDGGSYGGSSVFYHIRSAPTLAPAPALAPPQEEVPVVVGGGGIGRGGVVAKTLRLFGVDMECAVSEDSDDECDITTSTTTILSPQFPIYNGMPMSMQMSNSNNMPTMEFFDKGKSSMSSIDFGT